MKKRLMLIPTLLTMLFMGDSMLNIVSTVHAQEVTPERNPQDTTRVVSSADWELIASAKSRIDSLRLAHRMPDTVGVDSLSASTTNQAAEEIGSDTTNKPYESTMVKWAGRDRYGKYTSQCAAHANGCLKRAGYYSQGHAYQIPARFPSVINGYKKVKIPDLSKLVWEQRASAVMDMHRQAADYVKEHLDISKLVPGAYYVVNMYYTTSPYMLQFFYSARKQGTGNYGTHIGVLYYSTKSKTWIVEHNIHGHVHYDALVSILGGLSNPHKYGVTSISRVTK